MNTTLDGANDDFSPAAIALAKHFHDIYEDRAPLYGYTTRIDTRQFDPKSPNGRLMIAVCQALFDRRIISSAKQDHQDDWDYYWTHVAG